MPEHLLLAVQSTGQAKVAWLPCLRRLRLDNIRRRTVERRAEQEATELQLRLGVEGPPTIGNGW